MSAATRTRTFPSSSPNILSKFANDAADYWLKMRLPVFQAPTAYVRLHMTVEHPSSKLMSRLSFMLYFGYHRGGRWDEGARFVACGVLLGALNLRA